jgi:Icc protein
VSRSSVTLIQITDSHIFDEPDGELGGVVTRQSLEKVLQKIAADHEDADLLVLTGDNTHESTEKAYEDLKAMLETLPVPYVFLPGNHDYSEPMQSLASDRDGAAKWMTLGGWNILLLDSHVDGEVNGVFAKEELDFVRDMLAVSDDPVLVFVHHHLLPVGCAWLDTQVIANADDFLSIVEEAGNVKAVINGHVHQEWSGEERGVALYSTPSTCMQFKPDSDDYAEDDIAPGFRWIKLFSDGELETAVVRVNG